MPPSVIKSIRDLIYYQYAKILAESAGYGKGNYEFTMEKWNEFKTGKADFKSSVTGLIKDMDDPKRCTFCGQLVPLKQCKLLPKGPDILSNKVQACFNCVLNKDEEPLYQWFGIDNRDTIPKLAEMKYLKLLYKLHEKQGTLDEEDILKLHKKVGTVHIEIEDEPLNVVCLERTIIKS
jgi:hypothetical protein